MSKIPIRVLKYINEHPYQRDRLKFQIVVTEKNQNWDKCFDCDLNDLTKFRDELTVIIDSLTWYQRIGIDEAIGSKIVATNTSDEICMNCSFKRSVNCVTCLSVLQSPLERKLYSRLLESKIYFEVQQPINKFGKKAQIKNKVKRTCV